MEISRKKRKTKLIIFNATGFLKFTKKEKFFLFAKTLAVIVLLNYYFYRSLWAWILLVVVGCFYLQEESRELLQKKKEQIREQFKELLLLTATLQKAGYSVENAFHQSYQDMEHLFGVNAVICQFLKRLAIARNNHDTFGKMWKQMGEETGIVEISEFGEIYEIAYHQSGNITAVMEKTSDMIIRKAELKRQVYLSMVERRFEVRIMTLMPFGIIQYICLTSPGYFDTMYHSTAGICFMTLALGIYILAYVWTLKIIKTGRMEFE